MSISGVDLHLSVKREIGERCCFINCAMWRPVSRACIECTSCITFIALIELWDGIDTDIYWNRFMKYSTPLVHQSASLEQELSNLQKKIDLKFNEAVSQAVDGKRGKMKPSMKSTSEFMSNLFPDAFDEEEEEEEEQEGSEDDKLLDDESFFNEKYRSVSKEEEDRLCKFTTTNGDPLIRILTLKEQKDARVYKISKKFVQHFDSLEYEIDLRYGLRKTPSDSVRDEFQKGCIKMGGVLIISALFRRWIKVGSSVALRAPIPISIGVKALSMLILFPSSFLMYDKVAEYLRKNSNSNKEEKGQVNANVSSSVGETPQGYTHYTDSLNSRPSRSVLKSQESSSVVTTGNIFDLAKDDFLQITKPALWPGATPSDPFTLERIQITLFKSSILNEILYRGILLRSLLQYSHPVVAHTLTMFSCALGQDLEEDLPAITMNLDFMNGFLLNCGNSLIAQILFHSMGGTGTYALYLPIPPYTSLSLP